MPLNADAEQLIRANLRAAASGIKPRPVIIGTLTDAQIETLNVIRVLANRDPMQRELMFVGLHIYNSRIVRDGYSIDDIVLQIASALNPFSRIQASRQMTVIRTQVLRDDGRGSQVRDEAVLECSCRFPLPEVFSVIPKGDIAPNKAAAMKEGRIAATLAIDPLTDSPG
jgi:hypothetical protein